MSIIPYNYAVNREVVLRHNESLVVYDPQSKQLALQDVSHDGLDLAECPYCHRPLPRDDDLPRGQEQNVSTPALPADPLVNFQTPDYFRLLHDNPHSHPLQGDWYNKLVNMAFSSLARYLLQLVPMDLPPQTSRVGLEPLQPAYPPPPSALATLSDSL
ncbi:MAG: hypothetical protein Q9228_008004 [Teloschistes exilis]